MDKLGSRDEYGITKRQINKVKGYSVWFRKANEWLSPIDLGFVKTLKEAKEIILKHKAGS